MDEWMLGGKLGGMMGSMVIFTWQSGGN